ncbi:MAG: 30S ribosome-binding factor RbfA [Polyangiaceae bacterium]
MRTPRLEALFCEELRSLFDSEINDVRLSGVRVTRVELSRDGSRARVWFEQSEQHWARAETEAALQRASGFLRGRLCEALPLKRTPELSFRRDPTAFSELLPPSEEKT